MEDDYRTWSRDDLEKKLKNYTEIVEMLSNAVLGGIAKMSLSNMEIIHATDGYYRMTGYTKEESWLPPFSNCGINLVVPEDIKIIEAAITDLYKGISPIRVDYRIKRKDGSIVWNSAFCSRVQESKIGACIDIFFLDITKEREQLRQNSINEERFKIISEQTKDVIFQWDIEPDLLQYSSVYEKVYGAAPAKTSKELIASNVIHKDDKHIVEEVIEGLRANLPFAEFKVRLLSADGSYYWALHRATVIRDENSKPAYVVGIITNITEFVENALDLQHKAEHDPLTQLLNRSVAQNIIEDILKPSDSNSSFAFVQFDLDRFKQINDFMGHVAGDLALKSIAKVMRDMFNHEAVLIRMGGDEFVIFLSNVTNQQELNQKLNDFCKLVCCDFVFEEKIYPLSISIGVSLYPSDGTNYQELYENADVALYRAKRNGGNRLEFFNNK